MEDQATLYWCDPENNTECKKIACRHTLRPCEGGLCEATFRRAFALLDGNGVPMVYEKQEKIRKENERALERHRRKEEERKNDP